MHSRTYLLLQREYQELEEAQIYGISATPLNDNLLEWMANVRGLKDSLWEGAVLQLSLQYTEMYNSVPPSITFNTIPFHPNVDQASGKPCIDFLDNTEEWNTRFTMSSILLTIQAMLSNPVVENAVHLKAVEMLKTKPSVYRQVILACVKTSKQIESASVEDYAPLGKMPFPEALSAQSHQSTRKSHKSLHHSRCCSAPKRMMKSVSFEDYHRNWTEIATSKAAEDVKHMKTYHLESTAQATETERQPKRNPGHEGDIANADHEEGHEPQPWEEEVEKLVAWTHTLSAEILED
ncbi:ubiquitin-conjugating enzyme E2 U isoform X2 [Ascaphus truei]